MTGLDVAIILIVFGIIMVLTLIFDNLHKKEMSRI